MKAVVQIYFEIIVLAFFSILEHSLAMLLPDVKIQFQF